MKIEFLSLFMGYLFVFLAVIFVAWIISAWKRHRFSRSERKVYSCPVCRGRIPAGHASVSVRCPSCGVRVRLSRLTGIECADGLK